MLKYRLFFGTLMTLLFTGLVVFDGWLDGSLTQSAADDKRIEGTLLCVLICLLVPAGHLELSALTAVKGLKLFTPVSATASVLFATCWYWRQFFAFDATLYAYLLGALVLVAVFLYQYLWYGLGGVMGNCGVNCFSVFYLGILAGFVPAIRIDFGLWALLMFVFVVKSSDIAAYAIGGLWGRRKFSPRISPGKTWEGMCGAVVVAMVVAFFFARGFGIMRWPLALVFGFCLAFIGQFGDLAESMLKRDAEKKDSAKRVPGFGGVLDIVDSPLAAAPFGYLFFLLSAVG